MNFNNVILTDLRQKVNQRKQKSTQKELVKRRISARHGGLVMGIIVSAKPSPPPLSPGGGSST